MNEAELRARQDYSARLFTRLGEKVIEECSTLPDQKLPGYYWEQLRDPDRTVTLSAGRYEKAEITRDQLDKLAIDYLHRFREQVAAYRGTLTNGNGPTEPGDGQHVRGDEASDASTTTEHEAHSS